MSEPAPSLRRRSLLKAAGLSTVPFAATAGRADPVSETVDDAVMAAPSAFGEVGRRIETIRYPLAAVPQIREPGEQLQVELDSQSASPDVAARLVPSFGTARPEIPLELAETTRAASEIWDREVTVARVELPADLDRQFTPGMYDLVVEIDDEVDAQPRAVSVVESFPQAPKIAIMGDPHVGDPRSLEDGAQRSFDDRDVEPFLFRYQETFGTWTEDDRWGAFRRAVAELNAADPDIVFVIGDLATGSPFYYQEYEDAYRILNMIDAPTFTTVGNHDGYITPGAGIDGKRLYRTYLAPWHYSVDIRDDLHFVSVDSYDWSAMDRIAPSAVPSTWGGQVRDDQLAWLRADLTEWRATNPDGTILAMLHHNPSWQQTEGNEATEQTEGTPGAEQAGRGATQTGGGWVGANRLAVRDLFAETGVAMSVSGHAHRDRLARYTGDGDIVETTGTGLRYVTRDDEVVQPDVDLEAVLVDGDGPLFVEATTAASGTSQYWGWRTLRVDREAATIDPTPYGYPVSDEFLDDRTTNPDAWVADNADLGLYSVPSYLLDVTFTTVDDTESTVRLDSDLATEMAGGLLIPIGPCRGVRVDGGEKQWQRTDGDAQDVFVTFALSPGETREITVECASRAASNRG